MLIAKKVLILLLAFACVLPLAAFANEKAEPLDYTQEENWVDIQKCGRKSVDVFFVLPTVADHTENEDGFLSVSEIKDMAGVVRSFVTTIYEDSCNVYMPFYRQASMDLANTCDKDNAAYLDILYNGKSYTDIVAALDYYFENYNNGKPFILAAHSQGSAMLINVLTHYMQDHKEYLSRMVAAYLIGFAPDASIFNEETGLKFATGESDTGVVISFTTEGPTAEGKTILLPENPMVINPLTWTTDDTYGSVELNKGAAVIAPTLDSMTIEEGRDDAQINLTRKTLVCTTRTEAEYSIAPEVFASESFHEKECSMYHMNLKENVKVRIAAYFAAQ